MARLDITTIKTRIQKLFTRKGVKKEHGVDYAWAILLIITGLLASAISAWHLYLFIQVENDKIFQITEEEENSKVEINNEALQEAIKQFDQKEARFDTLLNEKPAIVDPSL